MEVNMDIIKSVQFLAHKNYGIYSQNFKAI